MLRGRASDAMLGVAGSDIWSLLRPREAQWLATSRCRVCDTSARDGQEQEITRETSQNSNRRGQWYPLFFSDPRVTKLVHYDVPIQCVSWRSFGEEVHSVRRQVGAEGRGEVRLSSAPSPSASAMEEGKSADRPSRTHRHWPRGGAASGLAWGLQFFVIFMGGTGLGEPLE